jgi:hypothetical protein
MRFSFPATCFTMITTVFYSIQNGIQILFLKNSVRMRAGTNTRSLFSRTATETIAQVAILALTLTLTGLALGQKHPIIKEDYSMRINESHLFL